ncbi:MAG: LamG-like jellyroll fold domain-containing protein [Akkermansiaceae bacterium]
MNKIIHTIGFILLGCSLKLQAQQTWWPLNSNTENNYAAVNQGQLKNMAYQGMMHLQETANLDDPAISAMVQGWLADTSEAKNYAAVNQGQLKHVAKPFWDILISNGEAAYYPWTAETDDDTHFAMANIGQVKNVFNFNFTNLNFASLEDLDEDGLPDLWENLIMLYDGSADFDELSEIDPQEDYDEDGFSNLAEYLAGTSPVDPDSFQGIPDQGLLTWLSASEDFITTNGSNEVNYWMDNSVAENHGAAGATGGLPSWTLNAYQQKSAVSFSNQEESIEVDGISGTLDEFSFVGFVEPTEFSNINTLLASEAGWWGRFALLLGSDGFITVGQQTDTESITAGNSDLEGQSSAFKNLHFYTISYSYKNGTGKLYLNGVQVAEKTGMESPDGSWNGLVLGNDRDHTEQAWNAYECLFYNREITPEEVSSIDDYIVAQYGFEGDTDRDGILDSWEMNHFGNLDQDRSSDINGNGIADYLEANGELLTITISGVGITN